MRRSACLLLTLLLPSGVLAQERDEQAEVRRVAVERSAGPMPDAFEGRYQPIGGNREQKIDAMINDMAFFKRPFARSRLENVTRPCSSLELDERGDKLYIACGDRNPAIAPPGETVTYTDDEGKQYELTMTAQDGRIVQTFGSEDGLRTNVYTLADGGRTLRLDVTVESEKLPRPLEYTRTFSR